MCFPVFKGWKYDFYTYYAEYSSMCTHCLIALVWMPQNLTNDWSTLVRVVAWCSQATSYYWSQCWPTPFTSLGHNDFIDNDPKYHLISYDLNQLFGSISPTQVWVDNGTDNTLVASSNYVRKGQFQMIFLPAYFTVFVSCKIALGWIK